MENRDMFDNSGNEYYNYIKLNLNFDNDSEAERISNEIIEHKSFLDKSLGRDIGIEVALLDYITNINQSIHIPAVFDSVEISKIGHYFNTGNFSEKDKLKFYDTSILSKDINVEIERAYRYGSPFSILMFDLDIEYDPDFNKISVYMQNNISSHIRLTDNVYSYKKNCYVLLLPETNAEDAIHAAFNIRNWINDYRSRDGKEPLLICIGIAVYGLYEIDSDHKILSAADKSLREAKSSEGERVCLYHGNTILNIKENVSKNIKVCKSCKHIQLTGISIHPGLALGTIFIYNDILSHELESYDISAENLETELERIVEAIHNVEKDLVDMEHLVSKDLSNEYSTIFQAHRLILKDNQVLDEIKKDLYEKKINGEEIVRNVFKRWEKRFLAFEDEIFKNKSQDIADISGRIIKELRGIDSHILESTPMDSILFANRLLPSDTVNLNKNNIKALVTKEGSRFSHTAILSKAMNIPLVILEDMDLSSFGHNEQVIVDGDKGEVTINPSEEEIDKAKKIVEKNKADASNNLFLDKKELFYKGERVQILGAASNIEEAGETESYGGEGIGLFRMEVLYLSRNTLPDEETLINEIEKILEPCKNQEIVIRLLDIGGDKNLSYINITERYNSSLGMRGVRLFQKHPQLLETQLRAFIRIRKNYKIKILIPMVTLVDDIVFVRDFYLKIAKEMNIESSIPIGAMIETPAAVLALDSVLECSDFISIGTNDLIQYTMAADREKLSVSHYYEEGNKIVQTFLKQIFEKSLKKNISCSLCGELAQNTEFTKNLLELGCRNFTVTPTLIPTVRGSIIKET